MGTNKPIRCPECNRIGSRDEGVRHLCKSCLAKKKCIQCGEPAYRYLERSPYHSWYCKYHYERKLEEFGQEPEHIVRDYFIKENPYTKTDNPIPVADQVGLVKETYGLERK